MTEDPRLSRTDISVGIHRSIALVMAAAEDTDKPILETDVGDELLLLNMDEIGDWAEDAAFKEVQDSDGKIELAQVFRNCLITGVMAERTRLARLATLPE